MRIRFDVRQQARSVRSAAGQVAMLLLGFAMMSLACAVPGRLCLVAPEISGEIRGLASSDPESALRLTVTSRDVPSLYDVQTVRLSPNLRFQFDSASLAVAGREYNKAYRVFLHYGEGAKDRVIWRAVFSRGDLAGPIELDCDLDRPAHLGQPCWVRDPLRQRWLVDNGEQAFDRLCSECHGVGGRGRTGTAPSLESLAARRPGGFDRFEVAEWIEGSLIPREHGSRAMPIWGERLSAEYWRYSNADALVGATLDPLIVYLMSIQDE